MTEQSRGFTIAVVDDDPRILESLEILLESADYAVHVFASGNALLESGCVAEIDCLISDIGLPGMDGFELSRAVQAARPELSTILITGQAGTQKAIIDGGCRQVPAVQEAVRRGGAARGGRRCGARISPDRTAFLSYSSRR